MAEGSRAFGGNRRARYADALGSACASRACLEVAAAMGYTPEPQPKVLDRLAREIGTLVDLTR